MSECDEHDRCTERDKAECEWCMEEATTPANTTDHIAATTATRGDIASHEGDATIPAVVQDAQQYDWREDLDSIEACEEVWECADGCCTNFDPRHNDECVRLAAYIERLEAERDERERWWHECQQIADRLTAERDALLAEHEAWTAFVASGRRMGDLAFFERSHNNAERVIHGE